MMLEKKQNSGGRITTVQDHINRWALFLRLNLFNPFPMLNEKNYTFDWYEFKGSLHKQAIEKPADVSQIKTLLPKIDLITPHMDDFGSSELGSYALNTCTSVYETLQFITDQDKTHIYNIATYYTDTIDFKIQEERTLTELEIQNHPQMIEAWNFIIEQTKLQ